MNSVPPCEDLAPYLRQKLTQDKEYSWQTAPYIHEEVRAVLREAEYASKPIPAYAQVYQRSEYPDWVNVGGRYLDGTLARTQLLKTQMENMQVQINQNMINAINARNEAAQTFWRWS